MEEMSLSKRLRNAALERTRRESELVDSFVLDADGVIDLRAFDDDRAVAPSTRPAAALADTQGRLDGAAEVSGLYDESEVVDRKWSLPIRESGSRKRSHTRLSSVPLADEAEIPSPTISLIEPAPDTEAEPTVDLTDADGATKQCPSCQATGRLDLLDRFNQIGFYSCDKCFHMWQVEGGT